MHTAFARNSAKAPPARAVRKANAACRAVRSKLSSRKNSRVKLNLGICGSARAMCACWHRAASGAACAANVAPWVLPGQPARSATLDLPEKKAIVDPKGRQDKPGNAVRKVCQANAAPLVPRAISVRQARQDRLGRVGRQVRKGQEDDMPPFVTVPPSITPRRGFTIGLPSYSWGSFPLGQQPARMYITGVTDTAGAVVLNVKMVEGNVPAVGALVNVTGTATGVNVASVALTSVSINAQGVGTIGYSTGGATFAQTADGGQVLQIMTDVGETTSVAKGLQFALDPAGGQLLSMVWACTAATVALQLETAVDDVDAQYTIVGTSQTTLTGSIIGTVPQNARFARVNTTAFTGGPGTIWAKLLQSPNVGGL
jgi:hypothetical protein